MRKRFGRLFAYGTTLIILCIGGAIAYAMNANMKVLPIKRYFSDKQVNAVWDWTNPVSWQEKNLSSQAEQLKLHQINTVFVDVSMLAEILPAREDEQPSGEVVAFEQSIESYITEMKKHGIAVYAAAGNKDWSKKDQQVNPLKILQFVYAFNNTHEQKLNGIEFDIESYNQDGFAEASMTEKSLVLMEFMDMVDLLATSHESYIQKSGDQSLDIGFAVPYWLDNENGNIESINWQDKTGPTLYHLMDRLNALPKSNIVVMAYRNAATGNDGMVFHARTEIDYAESKASRVKVLMGIETTNVEPEKITFFSKSKTELSSQANLIHEELKDTGVYAGIAINDLVGFNELKE